GPDLLASRERPDRTSRRRAAGTDVSHRASALRGGNIRQQRGRAARQRRQATLVRGARREAAAEHLYRGAQLARRAREALARSERRERDSQTLRQQVRDLRVVVQPAEALAPGAEGVDVHL